MKELEYSTIDYEEMPLSILYKGNKKVNKKSMIIFKAKTIKDFIFISIFLILVLVNLFKFMTKYKNNKNNIIKIIKANESDIKIVFQRKKELKETFPLQNNTLILLKQNLNKFNKIDFKINKNHNSNGKNYDKDNKKIESIKKYFTDCDNGILYDTNSEHFNKREKAKISIIIPGYNMEKYITRVIRSVQNQSMKDIEIVFVDDFSSDNTNKRVKEHMKKDHRLVLINNEENIGLYKSRIKGISASNGEFVQNLDTDDLLIGNILEISYQTVKKLNIDIVEFVLVEGDNNRLKIINRKIKDKIYNQPELGDLMWYGRGRLDQSNYNIYTKLIKKQAMLDTFKFLGEEFLKEKINLFEDNLLDFSVLRNAHSMKFINQYGYYYWRAGGNTIMDSIKKINKPELANDVVKSILTVAKCYYKRTKNNKHDKSIAFAFFNKHIHYGYSAAKKMTKGFELMKEVYYLYLNSPYLNSNQKKKLKNKFKKLRPLNNFI